MSPEKPLNCFKSYDIRGQIGDELNEEIVYRIGRATVQSLKVNTVAVGFDSRRDSPRLAEAVSRGICDAGAEVLHIGLAGTEEVYAAVSEFGLGAGIEIAT